MWTRLVLCVVCTSLWGLPSFASQVFAQGADSAARARSLFEAGVRDADEGRWQDAQEKFQRALVLRDSPVVRFNLAVALLELEHPLEARRLLEEVARDQRTASDLAARVPELLASAGERLAYLTILVEEGTGAVQLDERALSPDELAAPIALDPGTHEVRLVHEGADVERRVVTLARGERTTVALRSPIAAPKAEVVAVSEPIVPVSPTRTDDDDRRRWRRGWAIGASAAVVAAGVITAVVLAKRGDDDGGHSADGFDPPSIGVQVPQ